MKNILLLVLFFESSFCSFAQFQQQKSDSVCVLIKKYFNETNVEQLYALCGKEFQKQLTLEAFRLVCRNNLFPLEKIKETIFESSANGLYKYKAVFTTVNLNLLLSIDHEDKIETLLFQPYRKEVVKKDYAVASTNGLTTPLDKEIDEAVQQYISVKNTVGLSVGIFKDGKTYFYNYGEMEKGNGRLPTKDTYFEIGSISKTFTAALLADAVIKGKVKLDDPINKYLPDSIHGLIFESEPVTLQTLSNQSSGIPSLPNNVVLNNETMINPYKDYDEAKLFQFYENFRLVRKPGTKYEYSNLAVGTLGVILERVNKSSFEQLLFKTICLPLKMHDTKQFLQKEDSSRLAKGYNENGEYASLWDFKALAGAGAIRSTAADLVKYTKANLGQAPPMLYKEFQLTHTVTFKSNEATVGLGWHYIKPGNDLVLFHNGGTGGYRSYLAINLQKKYSVIILSNSAISVDDIGNEIMVWLERN
jgi:CubicO group peptidase (beta-lactamase class C family)